jgi:hypothetical protein
MDNCRAAERALVAALVMGEVGPAELAGRLHRSDFTDPAAGACFAAALGHRDSAGSAVPDLPALLRDRGMLRSDGYPISELLEWLPTLPVPAHPEAWATLVVAGAMGRVVQACGVRLQQAVDGGDPQRPEAGRILTVAAAGRAALHGALRRWDALPQAWRDTVPARPSRPTQPAERASSELGDRLLEREVLAAVVAAPVLLDRMPWLRGKDFTDPTAAELFGAARQLHDAGRPVDLVTLAAAVAPLGSAAGSPVGEVGGQLRPERSFPAAVPYLARRLVEAAAVRASGRVAVDLTGLAAAPGSVGGLGRPVLDAALERLDALRPYAERLELAYRPSPARTIDLTRRDASRVQQTRAVTSVIDRHAG